MGETGTSCETELYFQRLKALRQVVLSTATPSADVAATTARELVSKYVELMSRTDEGPRPNVVSRQAEFSGDVHGLWLLNAEARYFCMVSKEYGRSSAQICHILNLVIKKFPAGITIGEPESNSLVPVLLLNLARIQREAGELVSARFRSAQLAEFIGNPSKTFNLTSFPLEVSSQAGEIGDWCRRNLTNSSRHYILRKLVNFDQSLAQRKHE